MQTWRWSFDLIVPYNQNLWEAGRQRHLLDYLEQGILTIIGQNNRREAQGFRRNKRQKKRILDARLKNKRIPRIHVHIHLRSYINKL